jgi:hypothetical protein
MHRICGRAWRDDRTAPMQVVSGPVGRDRVHFEAPGADRLEEICSGSSNGSTATRRWNR